MRYLKYILVIAASLTLFACGNNNGGTFTGTGVISLNGGNGGTTAGGNGGSITTGTVFGDLKFHAGGVVDASFSLPSLAPNFGDNHAFVATDTPVASSVSSTPGTYYVLSGDSNLYLVNSSGVGVPVTGLTVNPGGTLHLPSTTVPTVIAGGVVINGTVTSDGNALDLRSNSFLVINLGGVVNTMPPAGTIATSGSLTLISTNGVLINQGTVDSSGVTGSGTAAGSITLEAGTFLYNTNRVSAKGDGAGDGGAIQLLADRGSVATSGTIDASGGNGTTGGNGGSLTFAGGIAEIGRVVVAGTVTSNGGTGSAGNGGNGGAAITLTSNSGGILVNATISAKGGEGMGALSVGGNGCPALSFTNNVSTIAASSLEVSPEGIKVAGNITMDGGPGGAQGGNGGVITVSSNYATAALPGFASAEFFGYPAVYLNGGASTGGNGGAGGQMFCDLSTPFGIVSVDLPAGGVINEVAISARGGDGNLTAGSGGTGGAGGALRFTTPADAGDGGTADPTRTLVTNSGAIDVSSGAGDTGGVAGSVTMSSYGNLTNSGGITARGGRGTTNGNGGGSVSLASAINVVNSGGIVVSGGDGNTGGLGGSVSISSGNQTTTAAIAANGGTSLNGGNGGNGGTIDLISEYALTNRSSLNVARGSGGSTNSATNGTITIDGVQMATALPASGAI